MLEKCGDGNCCVMSGKGITAKYVILMEW